MPISINLGRINTCKIVGTKDRFIETRCGEDVCTQNCFDCVDVAGAGWQCQAVVGGQFDTMADCLASPLTNSCIVAGQIDSGVFTSSPIVYWDWYFANHPNDPIGDYYYELVSPCSDPTCCPGPTPGGYYAYFDVIQIFQDISGTLIQLGPDFLSLLELVTWANANGCGGSVTTSMTYAQLNAELSICLCDPTHSCIGEPVCELFNTGTYAINSNIGGVTPGAPSGVQQFNWLSTNQPGTTLLTDYYWERWGSAQGGVCTGTYDCCGPNGGQLSRVYSVIMYDIGHNVVHTIYTSIDDLVSWLNATIGGTPASVGMDWITMRDVWNNYVNPSPIDYMGMTHLPCYWCLPNSTCTCKLNTTVQGANMATGIFNWIRSFGCAAWCSTEILGDFYWEDNVSTTNVGNDRCIGPKGYDLLFINTIELTHNNVVQHVFDATTSTYDDIINYCNANVGAGFASSMDWNTFNVHIQSFWSGGVGKTGLFITTDWCVCNIPPEECDISVTATGGDCICEGCGSGPGASWECYEGAAGNYCADPLDGSGQYPIEADCLAALATPNNTCDTDGNTNEPGVPSSDTPRVNAVPGMIFATTWAAHEYYTTPSNGISGINAQTLFFEVEINVNDCTSTHPKFQCCEGPNSTVGTPTFMHTLIGLGYTMRGNDGHNEFGCCPDKAWASIDFPIPNPLYVPWLTGDYGSLYGQDGLGTLVAYSYDDILADTMTAGVTGVTMSTPMTVGGSHFDPTTLYSLINAWLALNPEGCTNYNEVMDCVGQYPQGKVICKVSPCIHTGTCYCEENCSNITYDCDPVSGCYDPFPLVGAYTGPTALAQCLAACKPVDPSWNCTSSGNCQDPGNGTGAYSSLAACQAGPGYTNCPVPIDGLVVGSYNGVIPMLADITDNTHVPDFTTLDESTYTWINTTPSNCNPPSGNNPCEADPVTGCGYLRGVVYQPFANILVPASEPCTEIPGVTGGYFTSWEDCIDALVLQGIPVTINNTYDEVWGVAGAGGNNGIVSQFYNPGCYGIPNHGHANPCCYHCYTTNIGCGCTDCSDGAYDCLPEFGCVPSVGGPYLSEGDCLSSLAWFNSCDGSTLVTAGTVFGTIAQVQAHVTNQANGYTNVDVTTLSSYISTSDCTVIPNDDCPLVSSSSGAPQIKFNSFIPFDPSSGGQLAGLQASYTLWDDFLTDAQAIPIPGIGATTTFFTAKYAVWAHYGTPNGDLSQSYICCNCTHGCPPPAPRSKECLVLWLDATDSANIVTQLPPAITGFQLIDTIQNLAYPLDLTAYYTWDTIDGIPNTAPRLDTTTWNWNSLLFDKIDDIPEYLIANTAGPTPPTLNPDTSSNVLYGNGWSIFFHRATSANEWINHRTWLMGDDWTVSDDANKIYASGIKPDTQPYCKSNYYGHNHANSTTTVAAYDSSPLNEISGTGHRTLYGGLWYVHWVIAEEQLPYGSNLFDVIWGVGTEIQYRDTIQGIDLDMVLANINTRNRGKDSYEPGKGWFSEIRAYNCAFNKLQVDDELQLFINKYGYGSLNNPGALGWPCGEAFTSQELDGVDETRIEVEDGGSILPSQTGFTASMWVKFDDCGDLGLDGACIFEKGINLPADNGQVAFRLLLTAEAPYTGKLFWDVFGDNPKAYIGNYRRSISSVDWLGEADCASLLGKWKHITVTMSSIDGSNLSIYINGVNVTGTQPPTPVGGNVRRDSNYMFNLGDSSRADYIFKGNLGPVMTWNTALTSDQIQEVYAGGNYFDPLLDREPIGSLQISPYNKSKDVTFYTEMNTPLPTDSGPNKLPITTIGGVTFDNAVTDPVDAGQPTDIDGLQMWLRAGTRMLADQDSSNNVISRADYMISNPLHQGDKITIWECNADTGRYVAQTDQTYKPKYEGDGTNTPLAKGVYTDTSDQLKIYHTHADGGINIDAANGVNTGAFSIMVRVRIEAATAAAENLFGDTSSNFFRINNPTQFRIKLGGSSNKNFTIPSALTNTDTYIFTITRDVNGLLYVYIDGGVFDDVMLTNSGTLTETNAATIDYILGIPGVGMQGWFFDFMCWKNIVISEGQKKSMYKVMNETVRTL